MAFSVGNCIVVDSGRNINAGIGTFTSLNVPPQVSAFSPTDGATLVPLNSNILITFNQPIQKGTGNITLRSGSAGGTVLQTIDVSNAAVTISGAVATINPPSDLPVNTNVFVVVPQGAFTSVSFNSPSVIINTYDFTTTPFTLGSAYEGGFLICCAAPIRWVVSPCSASVVRSWYTRLDANTRAQQVSGCTGWFVPTTAQLQNPGYLCRTFWGPSPCLSPGRYWTPDQYQPFTARFVNMDNGTSGVIPHFHKSIAINVRAFRCVTY
jgi:hypothetical protein